MTNFSTFFSRFLVSVAALALLAACNGRSTDGKSTAVELAGGGTGKTGIGGDGDSFTGGDSRDLLVTAFRESAVEVLKSQIVNGVVSPSLCDTTTVGNAVSNLVRGLSFEARESCRSFFASKGAALAALLSDPANLSVVFTGKALEVDGFDGEKVAVEALTTEDPHSPVLVTDDSRLLSDGYSFGMLILHEALHHLFAAYDRNAGPAGFEGRWGMRRFLNVLAAAVVMAAYDSGELAHRTSLPRIQYVPPANSRPAVLFAKRLYRDILGREAEPGAAEMHADVNHDDRRGILNTIVNSLEGRRATMIRFMRRLDAQEATLAQQDWFALSGHPNSEELLWGYRAGIYHQSYSDRFPGNEEWFRNLWQDFVGLPLSQDVVTQHVALVTSGQMTRQQIASSLFATFGRQNYMRVQYRWLLRRNPTDADYALLPSLSAGASAGVTVEQHILESDEYFLMAVLGL